MTGAKFVTNNQGNEYRNANAPTAFTINNGTVIVATYNYQPNNTNNTQRYAMAFSATGTVLMPQTLIYAKTNDDCSMHQDESADTVAKVVAADTYVDTWNGCNGNGQDDGWFTRYKYSVDNAAAPTKVTVTQMVDVSLCPREERSRGKCSVGTDPDTVVCTWTEGNNQPQRDGVWIAAVDASGAKTGQAAILWKQQIGGKKLLPDGTSTYAQRAMHDRIPTVDPATGAMVPSDQIFFRYGDAYGNNNGNAKGGAYLYNNMGVIEAKKSGMTYVVPMTDMTEKLIGLDGTHLGMATALFGTTDNLQPGIVFLGGSHTGGGYSAQMRAVGWDKTANTFTDLGMYGIAPHDRHLYSNYLGNNPGNQGRNHSGSVLIQNPFLGQNGTAADDTTKNTDAYLMVFTTSGKSTTTVTDASLKLSAFISVVPVAQVAPSGAGTGSGTGGGDGTGGGGGGGTGPTDGSTELGGCSTFGRRGAARWASCSSAWPPSSAAASPQPTHLHQPNQRRIQCVPYSSRRL